MGKSRSWPNGSSRKQRKAREQVLERDGYRCRLKFDGCLTVADQAHHTVDRMVAGDDPDKMVAACGPCNIKAGDPLKTDPQPRGRTQW